MTTLAHVHQLSKDWNGTTLFENVNLQIESGERLALIGTNGSGKTTLIRILMGEEQASAGEVERFLPLPHWDWMRQQEDESTLHSNCSVLEVARQGKRELWSLRSQLDHYEQQLNSESMNHMQQNLEELLTAYGQLLERYEQQDGFGWEIEVEKQLTRLGIGSELWEMPYHSLSGGQKTRVRLAAVLTRDTQLLILDEPTNHLDVETMEWLEQRMQQYTGALLFVSHDREFVDRLATAVAELTPDGLTVYRGGYRDYREHKERELHAQEALYKKQEQQRKALQESIRRYSEWFDKAHAAAGKQNEVKITASFYKAKAKKNISRYHAKEKELERLEAVRVDKPRDAQRMNFELDAEHFHGHTLMELDQVSFSYALQKEKQISDLEACYDNQPPIDYKNQKHTQWAPHGSDRQLIDRLNLQLTRGDRLAITGPNGSGKTTLLRLMLGRLKPSKGDIHLHPALKIGYFSQELEGLPLHETLLDSLLILPDMTRTEAQTILGCFLFRREDVHKQIGQLSMGEKCRAALIRLYFGGANLLILDEPTNYLDIAAQEVIEEVLQSYSGTIVLVSHDRMLVKRLSNRLLMLDGSGEYEVFDGSVEEYEYHRQRQQKLESAGGKEADDHRMLLELKLAQLMSAALDSAAPVHSHTEDKEQQLWEEIRQVRHELEQY